MEIRMEVSEDWGDPSLLAWVPKDLKTDQLVELHYRSWISFIQQLQVEVRAYFVDSEAPKTADRALLLLDELGFLFLGLEKGAIDDDDR